MYRQIIMHGPSPVVAKPTRPSNPSALELAIYQFELKAFEYNRGLEQASGKNVKEKVQLEKDWAHLQREKIKIATMAGLQKDLVKYREDNASKDVATLMNEAHHPTNKLSNHLYAIGEPQPSTSHSPHHIVMGKGREQITMRARLQMHIYGLGINDPLNGVWLPRSKAYEGHFTTPKAPPHSRIHRYNYEMWVGQLAQVRDKKLFVDRLRIIKMKLNHGTHPDKILEKKDPTWRPE